MLLDQKSSVILWNEFLLHIYYLELLKSEVVRAIGASPASNTMTECSGAAAGSGRGRMWAMLDRGEPFASSARRGPAERVRPSSAERDNQLSLMAEGSGLAGPPDDDAVPAQSPIGFVARGGMKRDGGVIGQGIKTVAAIAGLDREVLVQGSGFFR
jgi:hypothetical protein